MAEIIGTRLKVDDTETVTEVRVGNGDIPSVIQRMEKAYQTKEEKAYQACERHKLHCVRQHDAIGECPEFDGLWEAFLEAPEESE